MKLVNWEIVTTREKTSYLKKKTYDSLVSHVGERVIYWSQ
jgi:hypothetical protein